MNFKLLFYCVIILLFSGCSKPVYNTENFNASNYDSFYIVDTIKIIDPVFISSKKFGGNFIASRQILNDYKGKVDFFYRPDVFLFSDQFYRDIPVKDLLSKKYKYFYEGNCIRSARKIQANGLYLSDFKDAPKGFILALINAGHYYKKHFAFDVKNFSYPDRNNKIIYYKIVYPLCK